MSDTAMEKTPRTPAAGEDLIKLYSKRILALSADIPLSDRLESPQATVMKRSPLCGSTVIVDLNYENGAVAAFGQDVKACALGQASASVLGRNILGLGRAEIAAGRDQLRAMLKEGEPAPEAPFDGLEALLPARDYRNRHASILLAFEAALEAIDQIESAARAGGESGSE